MSSSPIWWKDARLLEYVLAGAWAKVSSGFFTQLKEAIKAKDVAKAQEILKSASELGPMMVKAIGHKAKAVLTNVHKKAVKSWGSEIKAITTKKAASDKFQQYIADMVDSQVAEFLAVHPDRIITPQIERELQYLKESDLTTTVDVADILERLERIEPQSQYWQNLSTVQVSRLWQSDGMLMARDNGIKRVVITGPVDDLTCPVCRRMVGIEYDIEAIADKIDSSINLANIDEYVAAWPFPRIKDVDNLSREELAAKMYFVPIHPNCRHAATLLSR